MSELSHAERRARLLAAIPSFDADHAYRMGYDCGANGPNTTNCHFAIFRTPENTAAWERGKRAATPTAPEGAGEASDG